MSMTSTELYYSRKAYAKALAGDSKMTEIAKYKAELAEKIAKRNDLDTEIQKMRTFVVRNAIATLLVEMKEQGVSQLRYRGLVILSTDETDICEIEMR